MAASQAQILEDRKPENQRKSFALTFRHFSNIANRSVKNSFGTKLRLVLDLFCGIEQFLPGLAVSRGVHYSAVC